MRDLSPGVPHQGRHSGDAPRRSDDRAVDITTNLLLVRLRQIGDVVFTTPALRALRDHFPEARLTYLVEPGAAEVVAHHPAVDDVIVAPRQSGLGGLIADLRLGRTLRARHFDIAIDFHGGPRASLLTWLSRAPLRVGYEVAGRHWMYTRVVPRARALRARHSVENQWDLLTALGLPAADRERYPVEMAVTDADRAAVQQRLRGLGTEATLIVMHVSAGNPFRRWPIASFADVAATLAGRDVTRRVIVTSGPSEADAADRVVDEARRRIGGGDHARITAWSRDLSLAGLRALLEHASLYIGGDSGPMHIASTTHVPMVSIYGPTLPARSEPWRSGRLPAIALETIGLACRPCEQRVCVHGDFRCLGRISPEAVVAAAESLLPR